MSGFQSTLDTEDGIAEELAANQRSISVAEFFEKNKHMLGFDSNARAIITAIKEGVDNALDATEEAGILPDLYVEVREDGDYYKLILEDNGPGLPKSNIPKVFGKLLYGSRFGSMTQSRGQQGIGISAAVLYSQLTSGKPAKITSRPKGKEKGHYVELTLDTDTNEPSIEVEEEVDWDRPHGTRIELEMEANMRARSRLYDYIKHTAVVNPHARITFIEPNLSEPKVYERAVEELPQKPEEIKPHPHGVELGNVMKMMESTDSHSISGFLQEEFSRVGQKSADGIISRFKDDWFGREMSWSPEYYQNDPETVSIAELIENSVSNKAADEKADFASGIENDIISNGRVSHGEVKNIVTENAESVESGFATTFGSTVRENTVEAVWNAITQYREKDLVAVVSDSTLKRKDEDAVECVGRVVANRLDDNTYNRASESQLFNIIQSGAEMARKQYGETFGDTSQEKIFDSLWEHMRTVTEETPLVREMKDNRDMVNSLIYGMQNTQVSRPSTKCLSPITPEKVEAGIKKEYDAEFYSATARDAGVHSGHPFIVEAGLAYGGEIEAQGKIDLMRFANRVPLVYQPGACGITQTVKQIGWRNYKLKQSGGSGLPEGPVVLMVHVGSTNVPFTSESKDALASVPEIEHEIEQAVREVSRDLKKHLKKQSKLQKRQRKQNVIADILPTMAEKLSQTVDEPLPDSTGSLARIMNNILIRKETDENEVEVTINNFSNTSESFGFSDIVENEPVVTTGDVEIIETESEYILQWSGSLDSNESTTVSYTVTDPDGRIETEDIEGEKVTVVEE